MNKHDLMAAAYLQAVAFTDFGDIDQPPADAEFSPLAKSQACLQCRDLLWANVDIIGDKVEQAAHDMWLTRNGHGTGFWDRPEVWGVDGADTLTRCARSMGSVDVSVGDDGLIYFS
jgi:hypothetical protein